MEGNKPRFGFRPRFPQPHATIVTHLTNPAEASIAALALQPAVMIAALASATADAST
jgi:hypothetical protein